MAVRPTISSRRPSGQTISYVVCSTFGGHLGGTTARLLHVLDQYGAPDLETALAEAHRRGAIAGLPPAGGCGGCVEKSRAQWTANTVSSHGSDDEGARSRRSTGQGSTPRAPNHGRRAAHREDRRRSHRHHQRGHRRGNRRHAARAPTLEPMPRCWGVLHLRMGTVRSRKRSWRQLARLPSPFGKRASRGGANPPSFGVRSLHRDRSIARRSTIVETLEHSRLIGGACSFHLGSARFLSLASSS